MLAAAVVVFAFATVFMHIGPADAAETKYLPLTIEASTTIPHTAPAPNSYAASNTSPIKVCWEEPLPGGGWANLCVEITIKPGNTPND